MKPAACQYLFEKFYLIFAKFLTFKAKAFAF